MTRRVRRATVISTTDIAPHLKRLVVGGDEFYDFPEDQLGAYVKVLLPHYGQDEVETLKQLIQHLNARIQLGRLTLLSIQLPLILWLINIVV